MESIVALAVLLLPVVVAVDPDAAEAVMILLVLREVRHLHKTPMTHLVVVEEQVEARKDQS